MTNTQRTLECANVASLVDHLSRIARANGDTFRFSYELLQTRYGLLWQFICREADGTRVFCAGSGATPDKAAESATHWIRQGCEVWKYVFVP